MYARQIRNPLNRSQHSTGTLIPTCTINIAFSGSSIQHRDSGLPATGDLPRSANDTSPTMVCRAQTRKRRSADTAGV